MRIYVVCVSLDFFTRLRVKFPLCDKTRQICQNGDIIREIDTCSERVRAVRWSKKPKQRTALFPFARNPFWIFDAINLASARVPPTIVRIYARPTETRLAIEVVASRRALILFNLIAWPALLVRTVSANMAAHQNSTHARVTAVRKFLMHNENDRTIGSIQLFLTLCCFIYSRTFSNVFVNGFVNSLNWFSLREKVSSSILWIIARKFPFWVLLQD